MVTPLLNVKGVNLSFLTQQGLKKALHDLGFSLEQGKTTVLLGESGSGKSLTAHALMQLLPDHCVFMKGGEIYWKNQDLLSQSRIEMNQIRGSDLAMIFQEPMTSLNPVYTIGEQLKEAVKKTQYRSNIKKRIVELLQSVGISDPIERLSNYPHELSGGMKQRIMIAMALAGDPDLLIADEPTTALDVTIQDQVLTLLKSIQQRFNMAILLITHDFGVARQMADHIIVMYAGEIVELTTADQFFKQPLHPYGQKLFDSIPSLTKRDKPLGIISGKVPELTDLTNACRFAPRCDYAQRICWQNKPELTQSHHHQMVRCYLYDQNYQNTIQRLMPFNESSMLKLKKQIRQSSPAMLTIKDLKVHYGISNGVVKRKFGTVKAVDGVNLTVCRGKTLAIVGESGCGKTT